MIRISILVTTFWILLIGTQTTASYRLGGPRPVGREDEPEVVRFTDNLVNYGSVERSGQKSTDAVDPYTSDDDDDDDSGAVFAEEPLSSVVRRSLPARLGHRPFPYRRPATNRARPRRGRYTRPGTSFSSRMKSRILQELRRLDNEENGITTSPLTWQQLSNQNSDLHQESLAINQLLPGIEQSKGTSLSIGLDLRTLKEMLALQQQKKQSESRLLQDHQQLIKIG